MTDDMKVDSREVMDDDELHGMVCEHLHRAPRGLDAACDLARRAFDLALSSYAAKMGTGGRRMSTVVCVLDKDGTLAVRYHGPNISTGGRTGERSTEPAGLWCAADLYVHEPPKPRCPTCGSCNPKLYALPCADPQGKADPFHPHPPKSAEERIREALTLSDERPECCKRADGMARILRGGD